MDRGERCSSLYRGCTREEVTAARTARLAWRGGSASQIQAALRGRGVRQQRWAQQNSKQQQQQQQEGMCPPPHPLLRGNYPDIRKIRRIVAGLHEAGRHNRGEPAGRVSPAQVTTLFYL